MSMDKLQRQLLRLVMRQAKQLLTRKLRKAARDESGSGTVEGVLMIPIMVWVFLASYVFFDAYRAQFVNAKASYTIGDILSRETGYITPEYMDSLYDLQQFLVGRPDPIRLRVSVVEFDEANNDYELIWSENRGGGGELTQGDIDEIDDYIPIMADGEKVMVVQTSMRYTPIYTAGIDPLDFDDFVITRPRFAGQVCWNSENDNPTVSTATC